MNFVYVKGRRSFVGKLRRLSPTNLAWVAGLLEGEGCFSHKGGVSSPRCIMVSCHMTDYDVLKHLHKVVGAGHVRGPYSNGPRGKKPRYMFELNGTLAYQLMQQLLPLMCARRTSRIRELMKGYESVRDHVFRMVNVETGRVEETTDITSWSRKHRMSNHGLYLTLINKRRACYGWRRVA